MKCWRRKKWGITLISYFMPTALDLRWTLVRAWHPLQVPEAQGYRRAQTMKQQPAGTLLFVIPDEIIPERREAKENFHTRQNPPSSFSWSTEEESEPGWASCPGLWRGPGDVLPSVWARGSSEPCSVLLWHAQTFPLLVTCLPKKSRSCKEHQAARYKPSFPDGF